jgi:predicted DCC family thiol-disulfide oxidoreductase YuxK
MDDTLQKFPDLAGRKVIVFDGVCVLCTGFFNFVIRHDHTRTFAFATAQSPLGEALYAHFGLKGRDYETNLVILDGRLHKDLDALAAVLRQLGGIWRPLAATAWLPGPLKRFLYNRVARNRYAMFGRRAACYLPTPELRSRFLG